MNKIVLLVLLFVLVIGGAYYFGKQKGSISTVTQSSPSPLASIPTNETANWKTYSNNKYGFSFSYPEEFNVVVKNDTEAQFLLNIISDSEEYDLDIDSIERSGKYPLGTQPESSKIFNGNTWETLPSIPFCDAGMCTNTLLMYQYTGKKYRYDFIFRNPTDLTSSSEEILSTFKFTQ